MNTEISGNSGIRISQCMIVKNEEKNIERALSWGKHMMYEQIVVDTGSTDRTAEIAERLGAKVYHFLWIDDFSAAKNYAIEQAGGDWIAFLDADEYMKEEDTEKLSRLLEELEGSRYLALITNWINLNDEGEIVHCGNQMRFFRNGKGIRYHGRIHESLGRNGRSLSGEEQLDASKELAIWHTGYTHDEAGGKQKADRNLKLILRELEEYPDNYEMMGYLGDVYRAKGEFELAIEWYDKAVRTLPPSENGWSKYDTRTAMTFVNLLSLLCRERKSETDRILKLYERAKSYIPEESDFDYMIGRYYVDQQDYVKAGRHLERALMLLEQYGNAFYGSYLSGNLMGAWELLAISHMKALKLDKCVNCCVPILKAERFNMGILKVLLTVFLMDSMRYEMELASAAASGTGTAPEAEASGAGVVPAADETQVLAFLGKLYDLRGLKDRLFLLRAAKETEYSKLAKLLHGLFSPEELALMGDDGNVS